MPTSDRIGGICLSKWDDVGIVPYKNTKTMRKNDGFRHPMTSNG